jgi:hypothetical protein
MMSRGRALSAAPSSGVIDSRSRSRLLGALASASFSKPPHAAGSAGAMGAGALALVAGVVGVAGVEIAAAPPQPAARRTTLDEKHHLACRMLRCSHPFVSRRKTSSSKVIGA